MFRTSRLARALVRPAFVPEPLPIPEHIVRPSYVTAPRNKPSKIYDHEYAEVKDAETIEKMRVAARIARSALNVALEHCRVGNTTDWIDKKCQEYIMEQNAYPTGIRFHGFPRSICTSVNEVIVHGVPDERTLEHGDIINCDVSIYYDGVFGDTSSMGFVGDVDDDGIKLCHATQQCLYHAIALVKPGCNLSELGERIEEVATTYGYEVVHEFMGHFIGRELHMPPNVEHRRNTSPVVLQPGMTFTIEPILTEGSAAISGPWEDGWTYVTLDGKRSAQYEHTVLVTEDGSEILTKD